MKKMFLLIILLLAFSTFNYAQDSVTGAFVGTVFEAQTRKPFAGAKIKFINEETGVSVITTTDSKGQFTKSNLMPGHYKIIVSAKGYKTVELEQLLFATRTTTVIPDPILSKKRKGKK